MTTCRLCDHTILDTAYVCHPCAGAHARRLQQASELFDEIYLQIARQARWKEPVRHGRSTPLPYDQDASRAMASIVNTVTTWARHIADERGQATPSAAAHLMAWLAGQTDWLRYRQEADQAFDELDYAARLVVRTIDAPRPHWYAGRCACGEDLYGRPGAAEVVCRRCGCVYEAESLRGVLLDAANDVLGTAAELSRFVSAMRGELTTSAQIRGYAHRGRITAHGADRAGNPTYRLGDVLDVLERIAA